MENEIRKIRVQCASCSTCASVVTWPINTTNFLKHTKAKHIGVLAQLNREARTAIYGCEDPIWESSLGPCVLASFYDTIDSLFLPDATRNAASEICGNKRPRVATLKVEEYKQLVLNMVVSANLPFSFVDHPALRDLQYLKSDVPLLTRYMLRDLLDEKFINEFITFKTILAKKKSRFALTIDEWRVSNNLEFFAITIHYYDENFNLQTNVLGFENLTTPSHTGDVLLGHIMTVLKDHAIEDRIVSITRDYAGPINVLVDKFSSENQLDGTKSVGDVRCAGHVLNLATFTFLKWIFFRPTKSMKLDEDIARIIEDNPDQEEFMKRMKELALAVQNLARGVNFHTYLKNTFANIVAEKREREGVNCGPERILKNNSTRWLSTYKMLDRMVYFKDQITELLRRVNSLSRGRREHYKLKDMEFSDKDWEYLSFVCNVLKSFEEATLELQSYKEMTISCTVPHVFQLLENLRCWECHQIVRNNPLLARGLKEARLKILQYYPLGDVMDNIEEDIEPIKNLFLATVLDPRMKTSLFEKMNLSDSTVREIKRHVRNIFESYKQKYSVIVQEETAENEREKERNGQIGGRFFRRTTGNSLPVDELSDYLSQEPISGDDSIADFYHPRKTKFPILSLMARDFLATPAMSAPSESLFSRVNDMITKKRNRLLPSTTKILAILRFRDIIPRGLEEIFDDDKSFGEVVPQQVPSEEGSNPDEPTLEEPATKESTPEEPLYISPDDENEEVEDDCT